MIAGANDRRRRRRRSATTTTAAIGDDDDDDDGYDRRRRRRSAATMIDDDDDDRRSATTTTAKIDDGGGDDDDDGPHAPLDRSRGRLLIPEPGLLFRRCFEPLYVGPGAHLGPADPQKRAHGAKSVSKMGPRDYGDPRGSPKEGRRAPRRPPTTEKSASPRDFFFHTARATALQARATQTPPPRSMATPPLRRGL